MPNGRDNQLIVRASDGVLRQGTLGALWRMLLTPRLEARIERPHRLRDSRPVGVLHSPGRHQPSILDAFGVAQVSTVAVREPDGFVFGHAHVVDVVALPVRVVARCHTGTPEILHPVGLSEKSLRQ